jgi:hypothetical protein
MKKLYAISLCICIFLSCRKSTPSNATPEATPPPPPSSVYYNSLQQFYQLNGVKSQIFSVDAVSGGSFVTAKGTSVTIPANAFGTNLSGTITIEFRDIYKKSEMLLSNMHTKLKSGGPLQSAGEFYIRAKDANGSALQVVQGKTITVRQPKTALQGDQVPGFTVSSFTAEPDSLPNDSAGVPGNLWVSNPNTALITAAGNYVFSLYQFGQPLDSGTWCNSDNATYFAGFQQTTLTINPTFDINYYHPDVFLVFKTVNCMIHVYRGGNVFPYNYAPAGLQCTAVAIGVSHGKLYAGFTPITISINQTVPVSMEETTLDDFKAKLQALD